MKPEQLKAWFDSRRVKYPFAVMTVGISSPRPECCPMPCIRVPQEGYALWAFETEENQRRFLELYPQEATIYP